MCLSFCLWQVQKEPCSQYTARMLPINKKISKFEEILLIPGPTLRDQGVVWFYGRSDVWCGNMSNLSIPNSVIHLRQTPIFEWCAVGCGSKNWHLCNICLKEIGLCAQLRGGSVLKSQGYRCEQPLFYRGVLLSILFFFSHAIIM